VPASGFPVLDLAVADGKDNQVHILLGNGSGVFSPGQVLGIGQGPDTLIAGGGWASGHAGQGAAGRACCAGGSGRVLGCLHGGEHHRQRRVHGVNGIVKTDGCTA
jgi:hypothetical protein